MRRIKCLHGPLRIWCGTATAFGVPACSRTVTGTPTFTMSTVATAMSRKKASTTRTSATQAMRRPPSSALLRAPGRLPCALRNRRVPPATGTPAAAASAAAATGAALTEPAPMKAGTRTLGSPAFGRNVLLIRPPRLRTLRRAIICVPLTAGTVQPADLRSHRRHVLPPKRAKCRPAAPRTCLAHLEPPVPLGPRRLSRRPSTRRSPQSRRSRLVLRRRAMLRKAIGKER